MALEAMELRKGGAGPLGAPYMLRYRKGAAEMGMSPPVRVISRLVVLLSDLGSCSNEWLTLVIEHTMEY